MGRVHQSTRNTFTDYGLERHHEKLQDPAWIAQQLQASATRFLVVRNGEHLITEGSALQATALTPADAAPVLTQAESVTLLGNVESVNYVALGFDSHEAAWPDALTPRGTFQDLRQVALRADHRTAGLLAYAQAMVYWHHRHRFCSVCGHPNESTHGGHLRICTNPACGATHFPRTDPAIIVLVTHKERCLLARQPHWPPKRYSIIAGFVEPGESLEEAVTREVREESGVTLRAITYRSSQPWPFPKSLMVGFFADAADPQIHRNDHELEDVRWISREALKTALEHGDIGLPSPISISRQLISQWFDAGEVGHLAEINERLRW